MKARGFTLVECLIGAVISLFVVCSALEFLISAQRRFFGLKERTEASQSALAALDKMRVDLLHAGRGLAAPVGAGLLEPVEATVEALATTALETALILASEVRAGDLRLPVSPTSDISPGREICLFDGLAGEVRTVAAIESGGVVLREPLESGYVPETAAVLLLERVSYYVDRPARILRRKVNASPAQPLLESTEAAVWPYDPEAGLVRLRLELAVEGVAPYEISVFLKNPALARLFQ